MPLGREGRPVRGAIYRLVLGDGTRTTIQTDTIFREGEAPGQEAFQVAVEQEGKRHIDLNPRHQGGGGDAHVRMALGVLHQLE